EPGDPARRVRAEFLRSLLLQHPGTPPMHEKGLRLSGAWIEGALDLEGCRIGRDIGLVDCVFDASLVLRAAVIDSLYLDGSSLPGLVAERLEARGDVYLRGAVVEGAVVLAGARLRGEFVADGAAVTSVGEVAIDAARLVAGGNVLLRGAVVTGGVRLAGADIGADLMATGARITRPGAAALEAEGLRTRGDVALRLAEIEGTVALVGARVAGDCDFTGGSFSEAEDTAITLARATIEGAFILRDGARVDGVLNLNGASAGALVDHPDAWPAAGNLKLNHFVYGAILGASAEASVRLSWLARQNPARWGEDFWPHPYEQLSAALLDMGHDEDARRVLIEKERLQRRARRARVGRGPWRAVLAIKDGLLYLTVGFGRVPLLAFLWLLLIWLGGAGLHAAVAYHDALRPNVPVFLRAPEWVLCDVERGTRLFVPSLGTEREGLAAPGQSQLACFRDQPEAASYPRFNSWIYSLDVLLPGMEVGQQSYWAPDIRKPWGAAGRVVLYFQVLTGWALSLLAVAGFSGIVKSR
ncbi:MAG: hypothetical protein ACOC3D_07720, partial [Pseudomonadota bacterium]